MTTNQEKLFNLFVNTNKTYKEIAFEMGLSYFTIRTYIHQQIFKKYAVHSRVELIQKCNGIGYSFDEELSLP